MNIKFIVLLGLALTIIAACSNTISDTSFNIAHTAPSAKMEQAADITTAATPELPSFKIMAGDGSIINLADLKGKKVFVNLWASWCPPCRAEIPSIEKLQRKLDKEKVVFVMLSLDDNFELAKHFAKKKKLQIPVYYPAEPLPAMFNINGIPATFIFDEKGFLIKANSGMEDYNTNDYVQLLKS